MKVPSPTSSSLRPVDQRETRKKGHDGDVAVDDGAGDEDDECDDVVEAVSDSAVYNPRVYVDRHHRLPAPSWRPKRLKRAETVPKMVRMIGLDLQDPLPHLPHLLP